MCRKSDSDWQRAQFEAIARNEYAKSELKNPVDCSLYYLALKKKAILQGLWRMASWNREQAAIRKLLANNFEEAKWKTTALKNAYALMSKRRFGMYIASITAFGDRQPTNLKYFRGSRVCSRVLSSCRPLAGRSKCLPQPDERPATCYCGGPCLRGRPRAGAQEITRGSRVDCCSPGRQ